MFPSFPPSTLPSTATAWAMQDSQSSFLAPDVADDEYMSMTDLLLSHRMPVPPRREVIDSERYARSLIASQLDMSMWLMCSSSSYRNDSNNSGSNWADFLDCTEVIEYVSPDIERCLAEHRAFEVDQELDLNGDEFLHSPSVLPASVISDLSNPLLKLETIVPDSPARPTPTWRSLPSPPSPRKSPYFL